MLSKLATDRKYWYKRLRIPVYATIAGFLLWTIIIIIPVRPFADIPPIIVGGGPGTWFVLGYVLYLAAAVGGFPALSALTFIIEAYDQRKLNDRIMLVGISLLFVGVTISCILLAVAGAMGGYVLTIEHGTVSDAQNLLMPYVNPITAFVLIGVVGTAVSIFGMVTASKASSS